MYPLKIFVLISLLPLYNFINAQNYQAINGSSYAGSLSTENNPASIVNAPYAWDVTPLAFQVKQSTNAFIIKKYSLLSSSRNADISIRNGIKKRFFFANQSIRLLNSRISLNSNATIAFGANIRNYVYVFNSKSNWQDTVLELAEFMKINTAHLPLSGEFAANAWAELYGTYAQTIIDDGKRLLNAGITLKLNRSLAGGYANAQAVNYTSVPAPNSTGYLLTNGSLHYGYSSNFDIIDSNKSFAANRQVFLQNNNSGLSADIGIEYLLLSDEDDEDAGDNVYDTKIGISILDLGRNKYQYGNRSRQASDSKQGITNSVLENKFSTVRTFDNFNDSLATISNSITTPEGNFYIYQPARLIINADKHLLQSFFINTELTIPLILLASKNTLVIKDMNLLAVTPRWETKSWGGYFPVLVNTKGQLWVGGAFKAGPVLFGIHNLSWLFSKNKSQNGGLYLAFTIRPGKKYDRDAHYPKQKLTRKERRSLACPKF